MLKDGRIPEPLRDPSNDYRIWTDNDLQVIREELDK